MLLIGESDVYAGGDDRVRFTWKPSGALGHPGCQHQHRSIIRPMNSRASTGRIDGGRQTQLSRQVAGMGPIPSGP